LNGIPTFNEDPARRAQTEADLARVPAVARQTLALAGLDRSTSDFLAHSNASAATNADLIVLTAEDGSPVVARRLASAYARAFSKYRARLDAAPYVSAHDRADAQLARMERAGEQGTGAYQQLLAKRNQLEQMIALRTHNAVPVQAATSASQVEPRPIRNGLLGLGLGLFVGLGLAFLREALDTRVRSAEEVEERLGIGLLGRVPEPTRRLRRNGKLAMLAAPRDAQAEAFRLLRTNLDFVRLTHEARSIMVTSAVEGEGKSTTAANLAVALTRAGQRVALLDLDLRSPSLQRFFDLRGRPGLTGIALGRAELADALDPLTLVDADGRENGANGSNGRVGHGELVVIGSGPLPPDPGEFVAAPALGSVLAELRDSFDTILIDTPPALACGDAMALSGLVDGVVVVTRLNTIRRPMLAELRRLLATSTAVPLGVIIAGGVGAGAGVYPSGQSAARKRAASTEAWSA
jgi:Mrp family chromosome partitioning ATPase